jgi:hypothetical protein
VTNLEFNPFKTLKLRERERDFILSFSKVFLKTVRQIKKTLVHKILDNKLKRKGS